MIKLVRWIKLEVSDPPIYDGINGLDGFLQKMKSCIVKDYQMDVLDTTLKGTTARWWETRNDDIHDWGTTQLALMLRFKLSKHVNRVAEIYMG